MDTPIKEDPSPFHCAPEWHLASLSKTAALIYPLALRISKKSGKFACSVANVAKFLRVSPRSVQRGYAELRDLGFFVLLESGKALFEPSTFHVVSHKEWAKENRGRCTEKLVYAWTDEGDPLGQRLWAASGCKVKFKAFQVEAFRKTGVPEDQIITVFEHWFSLHKVDKEGKTWRASVGYHFLKHLKSLLPTR